MNKKLLAGAGVAAVLVLAGGIGYYAAQKNAQAVVRSGNVSMETTSDTQNGGLTMTYNGVDYQYNTAIKTILFLGVDKKEEVTLQENAGHGGQSDTMILFLMDTEKKTTSMLEISRNSMVNIDIYDMNGDYFASEYGQICQQYAYGDGEKKSCWLAKKKVGELFKDHIKIDGYLSMNIDGISALNDAMGGVTITVPEDYTAINPVFTKDATLTLTGEQAEQYVRSRDINVLGSNEARMQRQTQYLQALFSQMHGKVNENTVTDLLAAADPYMITDLDVDQIKMMASYNMTEEGYEVPGTVKAGPEHDEYQVNYDELEEMIIKMFYKSKE